MNKKTINGLGILIVISTILLSIQLSINNQNIKLNNSNTLSQNTIEYVEVPVVLTEEKIIEVPAPPTEEDIYKDYLSKLTEENREDWYKGYKVMKSTWDEQPTTIYDAFDEDTLMILFYTVENEVRGGDFNSKCNVASVIFNRLYSERFNNSLKGILTSPGQFVYSVTNVSQSTIEACEYAFEIEDTTDGCLFFHSGGISSTFNGAEYQFSDLAGHHFFRWEE